MNDPQPCPVCRWTPASVTRVDADLTHIDCAICGTFRMNTLAGLLIENRDNEPLRIPLSTYIRQANDTGNPVFLRDAAWRALAESIPNRSPTQKIRLLFEWLAKDSDAGQWRDYRNAEPRFRLQRRIGATTDEELHYLVDALVENGDLVFSPNDIGDSAIDVKRVRVTPKGWAALEASGSLGVPGHCFVAMSFEPDLNDAFTVGIKPAVEDDCGLVARRVDKIEHVEQINDRIVAEIRQGQCAVADFTGQRAGVYFEAGFALGLGRLVVWTCRRDDLPNLHFDTRQYNFIDWRDPADLRARLTQRLRALGVARKLE